MKSSIFSSEWWLDATAGDGNWGVSSVIENGKTIASMPWVRTKSFCGVNILSHPPLTQTLSPWLADPPKGSKYTRVLAREKDLFGKLIDQLPDYQAFSQSFAPEITNWLPFYWKGFQQTTRYTYRLHNLLDVDSIWSGFQENIKTDIRKAKKLGITVERSSDIDTFLDINDLTFRRQGIKFPHSRSFVKDLFKTCELHHAGTIFLARGSDGRVHAGNFIVWNEHCAYYLLGGGDPQLRNSGATSLALWHAIQFASSVTQIFDFEGSMIEAVERFVRGFGAIQTAYFSVKHIPSRRVASFLALRSGLSSFTRQKNLS